MHSRHLRSVYLPITWVLLAAPWILLMAPGAAAQAEDLYPSRPIRVIIPFSPGSTTDVIPRTVFESLAAALGQPIVVENRSGGGSAIGTAAVAKAEPDGYTLLANSSAQTITPSVRANLPYDAAADFSAIAPLGSLPIVFVTAPGKGFKTLGDLAAAAKTRPSGITYGSAGVGTATHLAAERMIQSAGIHAVHVPFRGAEALPEALAGRIDVLASGLPAALPLIRDGRLVALAVSGQHRAAALPDVPTTEEAGIPNSHYDVWLGLLAPAGTPRDIVDKLSRETAKVLAAPEMQHRLALLGVEPMTLGPMEFDARIREEITINSRIIKAAGIKPD
jgi:tripartite-type tricarboxylate transporter receptor subunit TctC